MSDWAAIEQALQHAFEESRWANDLDTDEITGALAAVGEAKRRESELNAELDASWEESQYQLKTRVILKLESQVARLEAEKSEAEARLAELERDRNLFRDTLAKANEHAALLEEALREAKTFYDSEYPQIAGQVIAMQHSGETVAEASWLTTANALHALGQTLKEALGVRGGEEQRT